jgi:hypothetical protein
MRTPWTLSTRRGAHFRWAGGCDGRRSNVGERYRLDRHLSEIDSSALLGRSRPEILRQRRH